MYPASELREKDHYLLCVALGRELVAFDDSWYRDMSVHLMYGTKGGMTLPALNQMTELELLLYGDSIEDMYKRIKAANDNPNSVDMPGDDDSA